MLNLVILMINLEEGSVEKKTHFKTFCYLVLDKIKRML